MPATPVNWRAPTIANTTTAGSQYTPNIVQLANGNVLITWTSDNDGTADGNQAGTDIIGQIFDPLGNKVGVEFRVNQGFFADNEQDADIVALPDGGFLVVYEDNEVATNTGTALRMNRYNAAGSNTNTLTVQSDGANGNPTYSDPQIAYSSATSALIVYQEIDAGGVTRAVGRIFDPSANTVGAQFTFLEVGGNPTGVPDVTTLTNGNYAVVARVGGADPSIYIRILSPSGGNVLGFTEVSNTNGDTWSDSDPTITALTGGGFVVAWTQNDGSDTDVIYRVFNSAGADIGGGQVNGGGVTDSRNEPAIAALADGSFVIVLDDDGTPYTLAVQHFSATGSALGTEFLPFPSSASTEISVIGLADGRFQVAYSNEAGDIATVIMDTRDNANTSGANQIGTVGSDVFTAGSDGTNVHGWDGNDVITEADSGLQNFYYGDAGDDTIRVGSGLTDDVRDGGIGTDTVDWSLTSVTSGIFDLQSGLASGLGGSEQMLNFENLIGTGNADVIYGTAGANILSGFDGNDTLIGRGGADTLNGGLGIDTADYSASGVAVTVNLQTNVGLGGDAQGDTFNSIETVVGTEYNDTISGDGAGNTLFGGNGIDLLNGGGGADILVGNTQIFVQQQDTVNGDAGDDVIYGENVDVINGGTGFDSLIAINAFSFNLNMTATSIEYAILDFGNDTVTAAGQTVGVSVFASGGTDSVTGSDFADTLWGGSGNDTVVGGLGNDAVIGEAGADSLNGGDGDDRIYFDAQDTFVFGGVGNDAGYITVGTGGGAVVNMGASQLEFIQDFAGQGDTILGSTMTVGMQAYAGGGNDTVDGSGFADVMYGELGNDTLNGNAGNDVLVGGAGGDILRGGVGNDGLYGGAGDGVRDDFVFNAAGSAHADAVYDFVVGTDKIDLTAFAGNTFANVSIVNAGGSAYVYLNGQLICTTIGVVGLGIADFIMSGAAPADPGDTPIDKGDAASVLPFLPDDGTDVAQTRPVVGDDAAAKDFAAAPTDFALVDGLALLGRPGWHGMDHSDGWMTVLV